MSDCEADDEDENYKPGWGKFINRKEKVNTSPPQQEMVIVQIPDDTNAPGERKRRLKATAPASSLSVESRRQKAMKPSHNV